MDFSLYGHQIVCHEIKGYNAASSHNDVDGDPVPVPHFGLALSVQEFHDFAQQVEGSGVRFVIKPHLRFEGAQAVAAGLASAPQAVHFWLQSGPACRPMPPCSRLDKRLLSATDQPGHDLHMHLTLHCG